MHVECNLHGKMGMDINIVRGHQQDCVMGAMGGHALRPEGKSPKICSSIFIPLQIKFPIYLTVHLCLSKVTLHPTSVNARMLNSNAMDKSGMMCLLRTNGRPSSFMSHMCVDMTCLPSSQDQKKVLAQ